MRISNTKAKYCDRVNGNLPKLVLILQFFITLFFIGKKRNTEKIENEKLEKFLITTINPLSCFQIIKWTDDHDDDDDDLKQPTISLVVRVHCEIKKKRIEEDEIKK